MSWAKVYFWLFCTHVRRKCNFACLTSPSIPSPTYNFSWFSLTLYWVGREREQQHVFTKMAVLFQTLVEKHSYIIFYITLSVPRMLVNDYRLILPPTGDLNIVVLTGSLNCYYSRKPNGIITKVKISQYEWSGQLLIVACFLFCQRLLFSEFFWRWRSCLYYLRIPYLLYHMLWTA